MKIVIAYFIPREMVCTSRGSKEKTMADTALAFLVELVFATAEKDTSKI